MDTLPSCPSQDRDPPSKLRLPRVTRATTESPVLACHSSRGISSMWLTVLMPGSHQERTSSILIPRIRQRWIILPSISERIYQRCSRWMCILPRIPSLKSFFFFFQDAMRSVLLNLIHPILPAFVPYSANSKGTSNNCPCILSHHSFLQTGKTLLQ